MRIQLYVSVYLLVYGILSGVYLLWYFELIQLYLTPTMITLGVYEIVTFLILIYIMILAGAKVNEVTNGHLLRVAEVRGVLERVRLEWPKIMHSEELSSNFLNTAFQEAHNYFSCIREE